jgi:hypothetical protein
LPPPPPAPTPPSTAETATSAALGLGTSFVHVHRAAVKLGAIQLRNRGFRLALVRHFDEGKSSRPDLYRDP